MSALVRPHKAPVDLGAIARQTGYPIHEVRSRGADFCRRNPREPDPGGGEFSGRDEEVPTPDADAGALIVVEGRGLIPLSREVVETTHRPLAADDDLIALCDHNLRLLALPEPSSRGHVQTAYGKSYSGVTTDLRGDLGGCRDARRRWLSDLRDRAIRARAAELDAADAAPRERLSHGRGRDDGPPERREPVLLEREEVVGGIAIFARWGRRRLFASPPLGPDEIDLAEPHYAEAARALAAGLAHVPGA